MRNPNQSSDSAIALLATGPMTKQQGRVIGPDLIEQK